MKILVTGAGGFIGSHLTEKLVEKGYDVRALAYYNSMNSAEWLDHIPAATRNKIEIISGDIRDLSFVNHIAKDCNAILHLAALIGIPYSYVNPESYVDTNIKGTMNILEAAKTHNIEKIIHTSTSEVYGTAQFVPITEQHPLQGQSPYSASKIAADQMAYAYAQSFDLPVITIRPFNTFGPRQSLRAVIPSVITQFLKGRTEIKIGSTSPTRDFSYMDDTVNGFITALESTNTNLHGQTFNLGSNFEISIKDTIDLIAQKIGTDYTLQTDEARLRPENSEVERLFADNSKAINDLSWTPEFAGKDGFGKAIEKTIAWYKDSDNLKFFSSDAYVV
jgi:dTDP-glucose 4,6-dehydratase